MIVAIADTHTTIRYLFSDARLGKSASAFIDEAITAGDHIGVSGITIAVPRSGFREVERRHVFDCRQHRNSNHARSHF